MRYKTPSKVIISFKDLDQANGFARAIEEWFRRASVGGDAAILIADGNSGGGSQEKGVVCGIVGHDVDPPVRIERTISVEDATKEVNNRDQYSLEEMLKTNTGKMEVIRRLLKEIS